MRPSLTPAARASIRVVVPSNPRPAKHFIAAATMSSRRSRVGRRSLDILSEYLLTKCEKEVKDELGICDQGSADGDALARDGGDALVGREDAAEVERVARGDLEGTGVAAAADGAEQLDRLGEGVLLAVEARHEAAAPELAARLHRAEDADHVAPGNRRLLAGERPAEDDAGAAQERLGHERGIRRAGGLAPDQAPTADGGEGTAAPRRRDHEPAKRPERVARQEAPRDQLRQADLEMRRQQPCGPGEFLREHRASRIERLVEIACRP